MVDESSCCLDILGFEPRTVEAMTVDQFVYVRESKNK